MDNTLPRWLTTDYLQCALRKKFSNSLVVQSFTAKSGADGAGYASLILRVTTDCLDNIRPVQHSLIIKTSHTDDVTAKQIEEYGGMRNEMIFYCNYLPAMRIMLPDNDQFALNAVDVDQENKVMILEDLKKLNYSIADRKIGLDWAHVQVVLKKVATLHATSMVLAENGEEFKESRQGIFHENSSSYDPFYIQMFAEAGDEIKTWQGYEKFGEKFGQLSTYFAKQAIDIFRPRLGQTYVLNHGDFQINNMMFKYNEDGEPVDALLVSEGVIF